MGKSKNSKNNPEGRKVVKKTVIKTSYECSQCKNKCQKGIDYIKNMVPGRAYTGIACIK
jgi:ribosomal protein L44E